MNRVKNLILILIITFICNSVDGEVASTSTAGDAPTETPQSRPSNPHTSRLRSIHDAKRRRIESMGTVAEKAVIQQTAESDLARLKLLREVLEMKKYLELNPDEVQFVPPDLMEKVHNSAAI